MSAGGSELELWVSGLMVGLSTAVLLLAILLRLRRGPQPWTLRDGLIGLILLVWVATVATSVLAEWSALAAPEAPALEPSLAQAMVGTTIGGLLAAAFALARAWPARGRLGLCSAAPRDWGLAVLLVPGFLGVALGWNLLLEGLGYDVELQRIVAGILEDPTRPAALLALLYGALIAPLVEELLFRGLLLVPLAERVGGPLAVLLTGLIFGLLHLSDPASVLPLSLFGVALGLLRLRSGSLGPPILLHVGNNSLAFALALAGLG